MAILKAQIQKRLKMGISFNFKFFAPHKSWTSNSRIIYLLLTAVAWTTHIWIIYRKKIIFAWMLTSSVFALDLHISKAKKNPIKSIFVTLLYDFALKHFSGNEFKRSIQVRNYVTPQSLTSRADFKNSVSPSPILRLMVKNVHWFFSKYSFLNDTHFSLRDYFSSPKKICSKVHSLIKHVNLKRQTDNSE